MSYTVIEVLDAGIRTLILNNSHQYHQHQGVSPSGPMDEAGFVGANRLVGNTNYAKAYTLELMGSTKFRVVKGAWFAATGPNVEVVIKTERKVIVKASWQSFYASDNSEITITPTHSKWAGQRAYLAIQGGFYQSQYTLHPICTGELLSIKHETESNLSLNRKVETLPCPDYSLEKPIRVITSYQVEQMESLAVSQFFNQRYQLSALSNRMGYRLEGEPLPVIEGGMYSEGLHTGAIQIPPNGKPIVMLADRQTLGGYPKIGAIARADLPRFVQALPGQTLNFEPIDVYTARNTWRLMYQRWIS